MSTLWLRNGRILVLTFGVIFAAAAAALEVLPRREDPELSQRFGLVVVRWPGADALRMEQLVTEPLEEIVQSFEEVLEFTSTSRPGIAIISVELKETVTDGDRIWGEMRDDLLAQRANLPAGVSAPIVDDLEIDAAAMIFALSSTGPGEEMIRQRYAEELADVLRRLTGTKRARLHGAIEEEISVLVAPERLAALGLTPQQLAERIGAADSKVAAGRLRAGSGDISMEVSGAFESLEALRELPVRYGPGDETVPLSDLAEVRRAGRSPQRSAAIVAGRDAVVVSAFVENDQRIDRWAAEVRAAVLAFEAQMPGGLVLHRLFDQSQYTERRLLELGENLALGALFVALVVLVLMGWRAAVVVTITLPAASAMVLAGMNAFGIPIHQMSVTGLILALGLLIDNAIVMVDEVRHRMRDGQTKLEAVQSAVKDLRVPLFGSTLTTVLSFMPIALMPGAAGEFVGTIAISVMLAIGSSFALALTVVPALTARLGGAIGGGSHWLEHGIDGRITQRFARASMRAAMAMPLIAVALPLAPAIVGFLAAGGLTQQFFPPSDRDQVLLELRMDQGTSLAATAATALRVRERLEADRDITAVHWFIGESAPKFYYNQFENEGDVPWYASAMVQFREPIHDLRRLNAIQRDLDAAFPEAQILVRALEQGPPFAAPIEIEVRGPDPEALETAARAIRSHLLEIRGVTHTRATFVDGVPQWTFDPDTVLAGAVGFSRQDLARALDARIEGAVGGSLVEGTESLPVRVRLRGAAREDDAELAGLDLALPSGAAAPIWASLRSLATPRLEPAAGDIEHRDGERSTTVQGFLQAGVLPASVLQPLQVRLADVAIPLGHRLVVGGESKERDLAIGQLMSSVSVIAVVMVATLVLTFSSFRLAGLLLFVAFASAGLALGALRAADLPFGFNAIVGTMGLIGLAFNDAIVVLAAIRSDALAKLGDRQAIARVVVRTMRHVYATSLTTVVGFLPLFLVEGGFWPPVAITIGGGVIGATFLALYLVPGLYALTHRPSVAKHCPA